MSNVSDEVEIKVTAKRAIGFFIRAGKNFMEGTDQKKPVKTMKISGLGTAINCAASVATALQRDGIAKITKCTTSYPSMETDHAGVPGRGVPHLLVEMERIA